MAVLGTIHDFLYYFGQVADWKFKYLKADIIFTLPLVLAAPRLV